MLCNVNTNSSGGSSPGVVSYQEATTVQTGLMSAQDKKKLNSLASITTAGANITIENGTIKAANTTYSAGSNITINGTTISGTPNTTYSAASTTTAGLMSAADKKKLNSLASITTAGDNITITGGTIKAAGGGGNYSEATTLQAGLMSAVDKQHLDSVFQLSSDFVDTVLAGIGSKFIPAASNVSDFITHSDYNIQFFDSKLQKILQGTDYEVKTSSQVAVYSDMQSSSNRHTLSCNTSGYKTSLVSSAGYYVTLASGNSTLDYNYSIAKLTEGGGFILRDSTVYSNSAHASQKSGGIAVIPFYCYFNGQPSLGSVLTIESAATVWGATRTFTAIRSIFDPFHIAFCTETSLSSSSSSFFYKTAIFKEKTIALTTITNPTTIHFKPPLRVTKPEIILDPTSATGTRAIIQASSETQILPFWTEYYNTQYVTVHHGAAQQKTEVSSDDHLFSPGLYAGVWLTKDRHNCYFVKAKISSSQLTYATYNIPSLFGTSTFFEIWSFHAHSNTTSKTNKTLLDIIDDLLL